VLTVIRVRVLVGVIRVRVSVESQFHSHQAHVLPQPLEQRLGGHR
jgi:hypothetical protein